MIDTEALRKKVIDLAIQGKLTEQLPSDGDAETLYTQILDQKIQLIKEGKIKKDKELPDIAADEKPFEIPDNWKWVRIGEISAVVSKGTTPRGGNVAYLDSGIGFLRVENLVGYDKIDRSSLKYINEETHNGFLKRSILEAGDVLISIAGTLGRTGLVRESDLPLNTNQAIAFIRLANKTIVDGEYIAYILNALTVQKELGNRKVAMAIPNLSLEVISKAIIPLPPLEEQKRIVDVVKCSFAILDNIDYLQTKYSSDLAVLKSKIIDAGIQGKLTEQLPEDGTAEDLYAQIQEEKVKLVKEGRIKKEKPLPDIAEDEIPFDIPKNWKWVRFGDLMWNRDSERIPVSVADRKKLKKTYDYYGASGVIDKVEDYIFDEKLLLIGEDGANLIARSTPIAFIADGKYWVNNHAHVLGAYRYDYLDFVKHYINSISLVPYVTGSAQPKLNQENMNKIVVPLPPYAEQERIVKKIEDLLNISE